MAKNRRKSVAEQMKTQNDMQYPFYVHDQYVKDLSFENPNFLIKYNEKEKIPTITVNLETNVARVGDKNYEVILSISVKSTLEKVTVFIVDLKYAGLLSVQPDIAEDLKETILLVHCPFLLFPFARAIIADVTCAGGYQPLMIEPIDFAALYLEKKKQTANTKTDD
jgi:preprotein translocase subunit SecB